MEGYGKYLYSNGDVFEGNWKNNRANGSGKFFTIKGYSYDGEW